MLTVAWIGSGWLVGLATGWLAHTAFVRHKFDQQYKELERVKDYLARVISQRDHATSLVTSKIREYKELDKQLQNSLDTIAELRHQIAYPEPKKRKKDGKLDPKES